MARTIAFADLKSLEGQEIGVSDWLEVDQARIDSFAAATGDRQWIHVDVERANREMGGTIAHGYLTLSLIPYLSSQIVEVEGKPGCGTGIYQEDLPNHGKGADGKVPTQIQCSCGAVLRAFANLDHMRA